MAARTLPKPIENGDVFSRLTVIGEIPPEQRRSYHLRWLCQCSCGETTDADTASLRYGRKKSCGCLKRSVLGEWSRVHRRTHGMSVGGLHNLPPEYGVWRSMVRRCHDPKIKGYQAYGARGVTVCDEWRNDAAAFCRDMGPRPTPKHTLDRIDSGGPYALWNCRWATMKEQQRNRRNNIVVEHEGKPVLLTVLAERLGMSRHTLWSRHERGETGATLVRPTRRGSPGRSYRP